MSNLAHILGLLYDRPWCILPDTLAVFIAIAERQSVAPEIVAAALHFDPARRETAVYAHQLQIPLQAVATREGTPVEGSRTLTRRGGTAILSIEGPITRRPMNSMSGPRGASVDYLARDFQIALADDSFTSILLDVDSPGGEVNGIAELAQMIYDAQEHKPIWAYVSDLGASAAYWLASAAERIVVAETAALGSIGAVAAVRNPAAYEKTELEFVSSVSPHKRADPTTDAGAAQIQDLVDSLGEIFVSAVARQRGVDAETVTSRFGGGGLLIGRAAVAAGLADQAGSFEGTLADLADVGRGLQRPSATRSATTAARTADFEIKIDQRALAETIADEVTKAATTQIAGHERAGRRYPMSDFMGRLRALVDSTDSPASADTEAQILTANLPGGASAVQVTPATGASDIQARVQREEFARLQAENARLKRSNIEREAEMWVAGQSRVMRCMPAEEPALRALFVQLAADDVTHGAIDIGAGQTMLRTTLLANVYATRPSRQELTDEVIGETYAHVLRERQTPKRDPNAPPDEARRAELLNLTPLGRQINQQRQATNGTH